MFINFLLVGQMGFATVSSALERIIRRNGSTTGKWSRWVWFKVTDRSYR